MRLLPPVRRVVFLLGVAAIAAIGCGISVHLHRDEVRLREATVVAASMHGDIREMSDLHPKAQNSVAVLTGDSGEQTRRLIVSLRAKLQRLAQLETNRRRLANVQAHVEGHLVEVTAMLDQASHGGYSSGASAAAAAAHEMLLYELEALIAIYAEEGSRAHTANQIVTVVTFAVVVVALVYISRRLTVVQLQSLAHEHRSTHDSLTGLPNRAFLNQILAERTGEGTMAMFVDMDGFKLINDTLGHDVGDDLIREIARTLRELVPPEGMVARLGGDEFVVLLPGLCTAAAAAELAERIVRAVQRPVPVGKTTLYLSASIGIAHSQEVGGNLTDLLRAADTAMYEAKRRGKGRWVPYGQTKRIPAVSQLELGQELHGALEGGELRLMYQPIWSLADHRLVGVEALVRWQHPTRGLLMPGDFLPVAEAAGMLVALDRWVLKEACRQRAAWAASFPELRFCVSVNLSPLNFLHEDFVAYVDAVAAGLSPGDLQLEILESDRLQDVYGAREVLAERGYRLAVDDFGVGFSNLEALLAVPVTVLKLDRSLVQNALRNPRYSAVLGAVAAVAKNLGVQLTAEGIENEEQLELVKAMGMDTAQGFYLGRPQNVEACGLLLQKPQG